MKKKKRGKNVNTTEKESSLNEKEEIFAMIRIEKLKYKPKKQIKGKGVVGGGKENGKKHFKKKYNRTLWLSPQ